MTRSEERKRHHRHRKWAWWGVTAVGLVDYLIRGDISDFWTQPIANSVPILFFISTVTAAISEGAAEEAS